MSFTLKRKRRSKTTPDKESNPDMDRDENDNADTEDGKESDDTFQGLFRKRKRRNSNVVTESSSVAPHVKEPEPENKKSKRLSLASLFTTPKKPVLKIGASLQGSSGKSDLDEPIVRKSLLRRSCSILRPSMGPPPVPSAPVKVTTPQRQRLTRSWSQSVACLSSSLTTTEVKRQEAIYELYIGEHGMVQDLELIKTTYRNSLLQLNILTEEETECIFGDLDALLQLHSNLRDKLQAVRETSGVIRTVGHVLLQWVPGLECYMSYCSRHVKAKAVLDEKKDKNKRFQDFLQRCLDSPFSRKLDLWTFLDFPRNRIVKYPILIGEILKHTPATHPDRTILPQVTPLLNALLHKVDKAMGMAECKHTLSRLVWNPEVKTPECDLLESATAVLCEGDLRDQRGTKLHCLLFDVGFLVTRAVKQTDKLTVLWPLIPAAELETDEIEPLRNSRNSNRCFKVTSADSSANVCHLFTTTDEHSKKRWMDTIKQVLQSTLQAQNTATQRPLEAAVKRRSIQTHRRSISDQALVTSSPVK
ncbi:rho guanine nucleotide exchange factor 3-like isoform X2 [Neocloeon triangulifer]|uniref:rho guanine nucleotide exchange factor 3-like isoform X2 n=1 Tax=Neocloeon triangulifer TaxID=2078957 RepID=UPI00286F2BA3|nr:rho guanine nucleotide exchange factor 3-like isoform X2 [Neocloeon triangulifer]